MAVALAALFIGAGPAEGQGVASWRDLEIWAGLANDSPSWGVLGEVPEMNLALLGIRFSRALGRRSATGPSRVTAYTVDIIPFAMTSPPYVSLRGTAANCAPGDLCVIRPTAMRDGGRFPAGSAMGLGFNPAGITTRFRANRSFSPSLGVAVGGLWFDRSVPTTQASRFNFTAAFEAGVRIGPPGTKGLTVAYRFHHISNAGMAGENPGLASHLLSIGIHAPGSRQD